MTFYTKKTISLFFIIFSITFCFAQKKIERPTNTIVQSFIKKLPNNLKNLNLKDLRESKDSLNIRVWRLTKILTINCNNSVSSKYIKVDPKNPTVQPTPLYTDLNAKILLDSLVKNRILELKDDNYRVRGPEAYVIIIEIATKNNYRVVSFCSPNKDRSEDNKSVLNIIDIIDKTIKKEEEKLDH
ncbi:hypothetical protein [Wenyingzhuangia marina]|uniref:Uncharacterized protein n=1 Tax=Wenyingzhuangia marina TaxID=1195760 RepID=A0A1M5U124_9FLAO|nr:hypothetical protein [Wenyingzhuangia marina]GGF70115.1 hypothetical protein GCM10011397_11280 [Wenyingzhuangia marina]SHH56654.1 hypothetical protein SAMN05444281_0967 [Wenyingzhuangia marina]